MRDLRTYILEGFKLGKNKVKKEDDYVDLDLPSKTLWCRYNVGATCESNAESWYGDYFMWGDTDPITSKKSVWDNYKYCNGSEEYLTKYCTTDKPDYWDGIGNPDNKVTLDLEDDMANTNMDGDWKMPTKEQLEELIDNTTSKCVKNYNDIQGLNGILFTSKTNGNTLFIPAAGYRIGSSFDTVGSMTCVWSSTLDDKYPNYAQTLVGDSYRIHTSAVYTSAAPRYCGYPVRAVMN